MGVGFDNCFGVYSLVEQLSFSLFLSILTFDFDLIYGSFYFLGPNRLFLGLVKGSKNVLGSTHVVKQLSFCKLSSFLIFDFYLILGLFFTFGALTSCFWGWVGFKNCFGVSSYRFITFVL